MPLHTSEQAGKKQSASRGAEHPAQLHLSQIEKMLTAKQVCKLLQICRRTLWKWWQAGNFPSPYILCTTHRWYEREIIAWIMKQRARA